MRKTRPEYAVVEVLLLAVLLVGCGGGSMGSNPPPTTPPPAPTGIAVTCTSPVQSGAVDQCSAVITPPGASQTATWAASGGAAISSGGMLTAPTVTVKTNVIVTATAGSVSGMFTVEVDPPAGPPPTPTPTGVSVLCQRPVQSGTTDQCSAVVTPSGVSQTVTWTTTSGTISAAGVLTAPTVTAKTNVIVTATASGSSVSGMFTVEVDPATPPPPSNLSYPSPIVATVGTAITPLTPTVTGTVTSFGVQPALPTGLAIDPNSGVISGTPTVSAAQAAYTITAANAGGSTTFSLTITVSAPAAVATSASSLTFDNQLVATASGAQPLAVINTGANTLTVSGVSLAGGSSFAADSSGCTSLAAGGTCLINVKFTPAGLGPLTAQMNISTSAAAAPTQVLLSGNGVAASMTFDNAMVPVGQSATLTWNAPSATSCTASGSWTGTQPTSGSMTFTPSAVGYYTYTLTCPNPLDPMGANSQSATLTAYGPTPPVPPVVANKKFFEASYLYQPPSEYVGLQTTVAVPALPATPTSPSAAIFLWPGLQPESGSVNFLPIDNGVLQPVLSFGPSCAQPTMPFTSWWISGQYVNTFGSEPGFKGCFSGKSMTVKPGDVLLLNIFLQTGSTVWTETVTDVNTVRSVTFSEDLEGQGQNVAHFAVEEYYDALITAPFTFSNTALTLQVPNAPAACNDSQSVNNNFIFSPPTPQNSNLQCFIRSIVVTQQ